MTVSRETSERLDRFEVLVRKWNPAINLVSRASLLDLRQRHIADSEQIFEVSGVNAGHWVDLGSGGGFPGLVVAILAHDAAPRLRVTCIESDRRKAAFLMTAARDLGIVLHVLAERIEMTPPQDADVLSARALAPLSALIGMAQRHLGRGGLALFPKGAARGKEIAAARADWRFSLEELPSRTDPNASILKIGDISRV